MPRISPLFEKAEDFANDLRVASTLCVSEPMPVMATNDLRMTIPLKIQ